MQGLEGTSMLDRVGVAALALSCAVCHGQSTRPGQPVPSDARLPADATPAQGTAPSASARPSDTGGAILQGHHESDNNKLRLAYASGFANIGGQHSLLYEICNRGEWDFAYRWEPIMDISAMHPLHKGRCDVATVPALGPGPWPQVSTMIRYAYSRSTEAPVYWRHSRLPAPSMVSRIFGNRTDSVFANVERSLPDTEAVVEVAIRQHGETGAYALRWKGNVGLIALRLAPHSAAVRDSLVERFKAQNKGEIIPGEELLKRLRFKSDDVPIINQWIRDGDFVVITTKTDGPGQTSFELTHSSRARYAHYERMIVADPVLNVRYAYPYATISDAR
jgi:hypothetical protein